MSALDHAVLDGLRARLADTEARLTATETAHARTAAQVIALDAQLVEARRRGHDLANRCAAAEGLLAELVEWSRKWNDDGSVDGAVVDAELRALLDLVRRDAGGVAVGATADGGGARGGEPAPSAPGRAT